MKADFLKLLENLNKYDKNRRTRQNNRKRIKKRKPHNRSKSRSVQDGKTTLSKRNIQVKEKDIQAHLLPSSQVIKGQNK